MRALLAKRAQTFEAVCFLLHWPSSSVETGIPDVIRHTALRSSDFPPPRFPAAAIIRPPALDSSVLGAPLPSRHPERSAQRVVEWIPAFALSSYPPSPLFR